MCTFYDMCIRGVYIVTLYELTFTYLLYSF